MYVVTTRRGRPVKDIAWSGLVNESLSFIENDEDEDIRLINDLQDRIVPRGCFRTWKSEKVWRCHFYIGKSQRVLGRGTLYQCAKLYDYALVLFDKYRVRKAITYYNFSKEDAEGDILGEPAIRRYFESLESYLLESKLLKTPAELAAEREIKGDETREKQRLREHKRTVAGTIETWMEEFQPHIFDIAEQNEALAKQLTEIKKQLDEVVKLMQTKAT